MRQVMILLVLSVLVAGVPQSSCQADRQKHGVRPAGENPTWEVEGLAKTLDDAEANALEKARDRVVEELNERYGERDWKLPPSFLRQLKMTRPAAAPEEIDLERSGRSWSVRLTVELTPEALSEIQKLAREQRMVERHRLAARGLAGLLAVLLVAFGYLRLEDATKGYHTTLLRLAALAVLVGAGVFLWQLG